MTDETPFIRRKFTLTESDDDELQRLADHHYDGNVSLCLRVAVADHRASLAGGGRRAIERVEREMQTIAEQSSHLGNNIELLRTDTEQITAHHTPALPFQVESICLRDAERVYRLFRENQTAFRVEDVIERSELPPQRVLTAIEFLVDLAYLQQTADDRYQLPTSTNPSDND